MAAVFHFCLKEGFVGRSSTEHWHRLKERASISSTATVQNGKFGALAKAG